MKTNMEPTSKHAPSRRFAIAVSFPGEHRSFVLNVVKRLAEELGRERVFYDEWYEGELVGIDGDLKLRRYYREQSEIVVPFFSKYYQKKWCEIEWHAIRAMLLDRRAEDAVVPVDMDGTQIEGWESVDFVIPLKNRSEIEIAEVILDAYRHRNPLVSHMTKSVSPAQALKGQQEANANSKQRSTDLPADPQSMLARAKEQLQPLAEQLLGSDVTRQFILKHNQLPSFTSSTTKRTGPLRLRWRQIAHC